MRNGIVSPAFLSDEGKRLVSNIETICNLLSFQGSFLLASYFCLSFSVSVFQTEKVAILAAQKPHNEACKSICANIKQNWSSFCTDLLHSQSCWCLKKERWFALLCITLAPKGGFVLCLWGWFCEHLVLMGTGSDGCRILMLPLAPTGLHFWKML